MWRLGDAYVPEYYRQICPRTAIVWCTQIIRLSFGIDGPYQKKPSIASLAKSTCVWEVKVVSRSRSYNNPDAC
jgi:hypothetical protein